METIIFATKNKGKIKEINAILADMDVNVISMEDAGITIDVVEDGTTFEENALIKSRTIRDYVKNAIVLSDDSGLYSKLTKKGKSARFILPIPASKIQ